MDQQGSSDIRRMGQLAPYLHLQLEARQVAKWHWVEGIIEWRRVKLQQHAGTAAHDVWDYIAPTKAYQHRVSRRTAVIHCQVVLHHVALVPHPATIGVSEHKQCAVAGGYRTQTSRNGVIRNKDE